ncbi:hypothetical protein Scep_023992 [Stephania cephalantha]|uniref:Uncharacterized protein n=1 Tax=Stephania cephalantha TaxID=152367 RepID=A0AAP0F154_9MAGN
MKKTNREGYSDKGEREREGEERSGREKERDGARSQQRLVDEWTSRGACEAAVGGGRQRREQPQRERAARVSSGREERDSGGGAGEAASNGSGGDRQGAAGRQRRRGSGSDRQRRCRDNYAAAATAWQRQRRLCGIDCGKVNGVEPLRGGALSNRSILDEGCESTSSTTRWIQMVLKAMGQVSRTRVSIGVVAARNRGHDLESHYSNEMCFIRAPLISLIRDILGTAMPYQMTESAWRCRDSATPTCGTRIRWS